MVEVIVMGWQKKETTPEPQNAQRKLEEISDVMQESNCREEILFMREKSSKHWSASSGRREASSRSLRSRRDQHTFLCRDQCAC